jgi:prepilin-type N-terminal cleavage/methylation domain-containing protein
MPEARRKNESGFSLLELLASISILVVIAAGVFSALSYYLGAYQRTQLTADMHDTTRSAIDLMTQEIGQAGLLSSSSSQLTTLSAAVAAGVAAQSVALASTANLFVGEKLMVDIGSNQEVVPITAISSNNISGIFGKSHISGASVNAAGVFPQGVLSTSTANQLQLVGDINGDGTLVYVEYNCNNQSPGPGTLTRSITLISSASKNASSVLVDNVMPNPGGTACFQFPSPLPTATIAGTTYTFVPQVGVTLTVQSSSRDPVTGSYLTITKQALDLVPRNVQMGLALGNAGIANRLQPKPSSVPMS